MAHAKSEAVPKRSGAIPDAGMSDGQLLGRFNARRDESAETAFAALVRRHGPMVLRVCGQILGDRHGAEDAFQATFLVLARRSAAIRRPELLGNWLHGVALRTAREAKMREARRRNLETPAAEALHREPADDAGRPEVALICREDYEALHEEVSRLPERFRLAVVLCELEGLSYREVARRLHCPASTIGVRLIRARERLRARMIRRGIVPAAVLAHALSDAGGASARMPSALVDATVRAAAGFAAGDAAAMGSVSAAVVALTRAVLKTMAVARFKLATGVVLSVGLTATVGWVGGHRQARMIPASAGPSVLLPRAGAPAPATSDPTRVGRPDLGPTPNLNRAAVPARPAAPGGGKIVEATLRGENKPEPPPMMASLRLPAREEVARGEMLFFKEWVPNDPASPHGDGLGPVFNESSCVACHGLGAPGGAGPESKNVVILTAITNSGRGVLQGLERVHPGFRDTRSIVLHRSGTDSTYGSWRRHFLEDRREKVANTRPDAAEEAVEDRIRRIADQTTPNSRLRERSTRLQAKSGLTLRVSERNSPALFGAGRIDAIPSEVLIEGARLEPAEVRGRVGRNRDGRVNRFGWKAQIAGLHEFVRGACASELGLEVPGHSQSVSPLAPLDKAKGLDLDQADCDALVAYVRALPAPVVVDPDGPQGTRDMGEGRRLFAEVGCAACHAPSLGDVRGIYSDLLLHEMGASLGDSGSSYGIEGPESPGGPSPGEWRTPPLWGFRDSGPYLHDGRAQTLEEAVALHAGQATQAARRFFALTSEGQSQVEAFLKSLVAPAAAATPGVMLAAELESRIEPEEVRQAEALVRRRREESEALEVVRQAEAHARQLVAAAAKRAPGQFLMGAELEKAGKIGGALEFYRQITREAADTEAGRSSAARIAALGSRAKSP